MLSLLIESTDCMIIIKFFGYYYYYYYCGAEVALSPLMDSVVGGVRVAIFAMLHSMTSSIELYPQLRSPLDWNHQAFTEQMENDPMVSLSCLGRMANSLFGMSPALTLLHPRTLPVPPAMLELELPWLKKGNFLCMAT